MATSNPAQWFSPSPDRLEAGGIGVVLSRLSTAQRTALTLGSGDAGLFTYDTQLNQLFAWNGTFSAQMAALNSAGGLTLVSPIVVTTGIITTNNPGFQLTQQWNNAGVTFTGWFTNITDTSSNSNSLFADFQINSTSVVAISKNGSFVIGNTAPVTWTFSNQITFITTGATNLAFGTNNTTRAFFNSTGSFLAGTDGVSDIGATGANRFNNLFIKGVLTVGSTTLVTTSVALTDAVGVAAGTITNAPSAGNPTKWITIVDNGTTRKIPTWT